MKKRTFDILLISLYSISILFALLGIINPYNLIFKGVSPYVGLGQRIWGLDQGSLYVWYSIYMLASALVFTGVMIYKYVRTNINIIKEQILISLSGFFLAVILVSLSGLIPILQGKKLLSSHHSVLFHILPLRLIHSVQIQALSRLSHNFLQNRGQGSAYYGKGRG